MLRRACYAWHVAVELEEQVNTWTDITCVVPIESGQVKRCTAEQRCVLRLPLKYVYEGLLNDMTTSELVASKFRWQARRRGGCRRETAAASRELVVCDVANLSSTTGISIVMKRGLVLQSAEREYSHPRDTGRIVSAFSQRQCFRRLITCCCMGAVLVSPVGSVGSLFIPTSGCCGVSKPLIKRWSMESFQLLVA